MSLPNQPVWACPAWGPDHFWHDCQICIEQYELFIEKAQGGWLDDELAEGQGEERQIAPIEVADDAGEAEEIAMERVSRVSISAYWWEPTNLG